MSNSQRGTDNWVVVRSQAAEVQASRNVEEAAVERASFSRTIEAMDITISPRHIGQTASREVNLVRTAMKKLDAMYATRKSPCRSEWRKSGQCRSSS